MEGRGAALPLLGHERDNTVQSVDRRVHPHHDLTPVGGRALLTQ